MPNRTRVNENLASPCMEVMNFLNEATDRYPGAISLAAGRPPVKFASAARCGQWISIFAREYAQSRGLPEEAAWRALGQYGPTNGMIGDLVARLLAHDDDLHPEPADLMITNGVQEALLIFLLGVCDRVHDVVLSDDPTYVGLTGAATLAGVPVVPLPLEGSIIDRATRALASAEQSGRRARALYLIPDFSNPLGETLSLLERRDLVNLARHRRLLLIEDTAYRCFRYEAEKLPTLKALDEDGVVVQVGSFSKLFMPGPRVGYLYADQRASLKNVDTGATLAQELSKVKGHISVLTSPVAQAMVGGFLIEHHFTLGEWNRPRIQLCRENRDALLDRLETRLSGDPALRGRVSWTRPEGGFFLALTLPFVFETNELVACARDYGVIVCPMIYFSQAPAFAYRIRLSFSGTTPEETRDGVDRLCRFIRDRLHGSADKYANSKTPPAMDS